MRQELAKMAKGAMVPLKPPPVMELKISKQGSWTQGRFAKAPLELLICDALQPTSKLLWIALANQADYKSIERTVLDRCIGIHRSTRIRCLAELRHYGLIEGEEPNLLLPDPLPILRGMDENRKRINVLARQTFGLADGPVEKRPKPVKTVNSCEKACESWNKNCPANYAQSAKIGEQILKAINFHMKELQIESEDYDHFFSAIAAGVSRSKFWTTQNTNKTITSIIGIGTPSDKKIQNVFTLYNDGLDAIEQGYKVKKTGESECVKRVIYPASYRRIIDNYESAQFNYSQVYNTGNEQVVRGASMMIIDAEKKLNEIGLDPSPFRFKFGIREWPTDTPEPEKERVVFWTYEDDGDLINE